MKLFGVIVLAAILSCFAGLLVTIALNTVIPCSSDPAGCGMAQAYSIFAIPIEAVLVTVVLAIAVLFRNRLRAITIAAVALVALAWSMIVIGLASDMTSGRVTRFADVLEASQLILPFCAVVAAQWLLLRLYSRRDPVQTVDARHG